MESCLGTINTQLPIEDYLLDTEAVRELGSCVLINTTSRISTRRYGTSRRAYSRPNHSTVRPLRKQEICAAAELGTLQDPQRSKPAIVLGRNGGRAVIISRRNTPEPDLGGS